MTSPTPEQDAGELRARISELATKAEPLLNCDHRANRPNPRVNGERIVGFVIGADDIGLGLSEPLFALEAVVELAKIATRPATPIADTAGEAERLRSALVDIQEACKRRQLPLTDQIWRRAEVALASHATPTAPTAGEVELRAALQAMQPHFCEYLCNTGASSPPHEPECLQATAALQSKGQSNNGNL